MPAASENPAPTGREAEAAVEFLGCPLHPYTMSETVTAIAARLISGRFTQHGVLNVAKLVNMRRDPALRNAVRSCDIINADGMGIVWGGRLLGLPIPERVAGIDLFFELLTLAAESGEKVYLLGARQQVLEKVVAELTRNYPELAVVGWHHGYFADEREIVDKIRISGATMLFVAMSSPRKEVFIDRWGRDLGLKFAMGVGGTFDVVAGETRRAPLSMQRMGLEWLYRVMQEPGRMWKRYLTTNILFLGLLAKERFRSGRRGPDKTIE